MEGMTVSAINQNMQENIVKSSLVQQIQERDTDIARSSQQMQEAFTKELDRKSHEVVSEVKHVEQDGVNPDADKEGSGKNGGKRKRRNPDDPDDPMMEGWSMGPDDDGKPHTINIIA